jgi:CheY-like chemotaxis protein
MQPLKKHSHMRDFFKSIFGRDIKPEDLANDAIVKHLPDKDQEVLQRQAQEIFALSPILKRAQLIAPILQGANVLWVDDHPDNNLYERVMLSSFGMSIDLAYSTDEAMSKISETPYDVIISDMKRQGIATEGLRLLNSLTNQGARPHTIFYVGQLDKEQGTPQGAFGITNRPDDLLHFVMDVLERERALALGA